ncbi:hypothetical protein ANCDUO_21310 [Ancylostoma duodenale]|uniref:AMP-dependent synthetase/ligase domain-containing protein n=1 Tax=Ancylostoma duodenale TaxID=51022 RepID=A0A0C2FPH9_9BILA|nr:hypothetical protein ANCDUO_21310 [Ancylostoma duodenale]
MLIKSDYPPVPIPHSSFPETLLTALENHISHNRTAFICAESDKQVTFKTVYHTAYALATFLHQKGFHKEVACAVLPNQWEWAAIFLGLTLNGGVLTTSSAVSTECECKINSASLKWSSQGLEGGQRRVHWPGSTRIE